MEYIYLACGILLILFVVTNVLKRRSNRVTPDIVNKVKSQLENIVNAKVSFSDDRGYDLLLELNDKVYLIKVITIYKEQEIVITNKLTWIINHKSNTPNIKNKISGIKEFMEHQLETEKVVKKVAIVYPNCHNILKYINENEMVIVNSKTDVYGSRIILFSHMADIENI